MLQSDRTKFAVCSCHHGYMIALPDFSIMMTLYRELSLWLFWECSATYRNGALGIWSYNLKDVLWENDRKEAIYPCFAHERMSEERTSLTRWQGTKQLKSAKGSIAMYANDAKRCWSQAAIKKQGPKPLFFDFPRPLVIGTFIMITDIQALLFLFCRDT